ncbi:pectate lyase superfamily protein-domain-containing protein [Cladorrhinum sp. PSN259]|nr:pectate lyase superfamily protein-domain-containing protein [Cladorrhinum sp. PSN259]
MHRPSLGSLVAFSVLVSGVIARATGPPSYAKLVDRNVSVATSGRGQYPFKHKHKPGCKPDPAPTCDKFWLENIDHDGQAPYATFPDYPVWRNVQDPLFGAKGDGITDDTAAINLAISYGNRCAPFTCPGSTTTPALIYFPPGKYLVKGPIIDYYYTQLIGSPCDKPVLVASSDFQGQFILDAFPRRDDPPPRSGWIPQNVFWRQVANFVFDTRAVPATTEFTAIRWTSSQATSLSNVDIYLSTAANTEHRGILIEEGSGGYIGDIQIDGGLYGLNVGNQQYTFRSITISNAKTAVKQIWDWGWTYIGITILNCGVGFDFTSVNTDANILNVGSAVIIDSEIVDTPIGIRYGPSAPVNPRPQANTFSFERISLDNVPAAIVGPAGVVFAGTPTRDFIEAWGRGNTYKGTSGPYPLEGPFPAVKRPEALTTKNGDYYTASKPYYEDVPVTDIYTARDFKATGDGSTDDTEALNKLFQRAAKDNKVVYINAGIYKVTRTIRIPPGSRIFGDSSFPQIVSSGAYFQDEFNPKPVVQIGSQGSKGRIEWSNTIVSTRGRQPGAIVIQYNLDSAVRGNGHPDGSCEEPSGMWDVHVRIGGFAGSDLQLADCPKTPNATVDRNNLNRNCIAAFLSWHITPESGGLYQENNWVWVADHDIEKEADNQQITIYAGRGFLLESNDGPNWLVASSVEHHQLYEYQLYKTKNVFAGQIQTETAYYQPNPDARLPQVAQTRWHDPRYNQGESGWGLRAVDSTDVLIYGAGLYSFFDNYSTTCSAPGQGSRCQKNILSIEGRSKIRVFGLNTVGTTNMFTVNGVNSGLYSANQNDFIQTIAQVNVGL